PCSEPARRTAWIAKDNHRALGSVPPLPVTCKLFLEVLGVLPRDAGVYQSARFVQQRQHNARWRCNRNVCRIANETEEPLLLQVRPRQQGWCGSDGDARSAVGCRLGQQNAQLQRWISA